MDADQMNLSPLSLPRRKPNVSSPKGCCMEENGGELGSMPCLAQSTQSYTHSSPNGYSDCPKKLRSCKRKWRTMNDVYGQTEATFSAMKRAREVEENLSTKFSIFVKPMIPSNVMGGFWLSLPKIFCKLHLPDRDTIVVLVDENGEEYHVKYLPERRGLSGGWRGFSIAHKLVEGDVLVFQLIRNYKFKVYVVRANRLDEVDGALSLLQLDAHTQRRSHEMKKKKLDHIQKNVKNLMRVGATCFRPSPPDDLIKNYQKSSPMVLETDCGMVTNQRSSDNESLGSVMEGLISETTSVADEVMACKLTSFPDDSAFSDKSLTNFEQLRRNFELISARLDRLVCHAINFKLEALQHKSVRDSETEPEYAKEPSPFEAKKLKLKEVTERLQAEVEVLKSNAEMHKHFSC